MDKNINQIKQTIILKYTIALSLIAILSTIAFYTLKTTLEHSNNTGYIVNISGKQRMLSQHIALDIHRIHMKISEDEHSIATNNNLYKQVLKKHTQEFMEANKVLSTGKFQNGATYSLSPSIYNMYFGDMNLAQRVEAYATTANKLLSDVNHKDIDEIVHYIDSNSEILLIDLNKVVNQYQLEGEEQLKDMSDLETIVWVATIIMLLLEVIFIFQPMVRHITKLLNSKKDILTHLEDTIEIRTMKLAEANDKLQDLAYHDPLTGLRNRLTLEQDVEESIIQHGKHKAPYAVVMFDIDWFKEVNDTFGHDIGDLVLKEFSSIYKASVRETDKIYRTGGEEFVIIFNRIGYKDTIKLVQKICTTVREHIFKVNDEEFSKTVSVGLYHSSLVELHDVRSVLKSIDAALYNSKVNGRDRVTSVDSRMKLEEAAEITAAIKLIFTDKSLNTLVRIDEGCTLSDCSELQTIKENSSNFKSIIHVEDVQLLDNIGSNINKDKPYITTLRILNENDEVYIYRAEILEDKDNNIVVNLQSSKDIAKQISDAVLIQNFHAMLDNTTDFMYFKDRYHSFTGASETLVPLTSANKREEFIGKIDYELFPKELADEYFKLERQVFDGKLKMAQDFQPTEDNDGNKGWVDNRKYPIYNQAKAIVGLFGIARVISDDEYSKR